MVSAHYLSMRKTCFTHFFFGSAHTFNFLLVWKLKNQKIWFEFRKLLNGFFTEHAMEISHSNWLFNIFNISFILEVKQNFLKNEEEEERKKIVPKYNVLWKSRILYVAVQLLRLFTYRLNHFLVEDTHF